MSWLTVFLIAVGANLGAIGVFTIEYLLLPPGNRPTWRPCYCPCPHQDGDPK